LSESAGQWLEVLGGVIVGIVVGLVTAFASSFIVEPRSVKRDRRLRHIDHLLKAVYGPIEYSLERAQSRAAALKKQNVSVDFALYLSEVKVLTETFQKEWSLLSLDVQKAWLDFVAQDAYLYIEQLLLGKFKGPYVAATAEQLQPLLAQVEGEITRLRHDYAECSGVSFEDNRGGGGIGKERGLLKTLFGISLLVLSGWFGEWPFFASWVRSILDWLQTGQLSAHPRVVVPQNIADLFYGLSWRVSFYRGAIDFGAFMENGFGLALLVGVIWILYEIWKGARLVRQSQRIVSV